MTDQFISRIAVRFDDLDSNRHVRGAAFLAYADHARWELVGAAGVSLEELMAAGLGPVNLETTIRFHRELQAGDEIDIVSEFTYSDAKTYRVRQELRRLDGVLAAEVTSVSGLLDLNTRRLVPDLDGRWRGLAADPRLLGL